MGRRKPTVTTKVVSLPSSAEDEDDNNEVNDSNNESKEAPPPRKHRSHHSSKRKTSKQVNGDAIPEDLPEGTVVVEPESASSDSCSEEPDDQAKVNVWQKMRKKKSGVAQSAGVVELAQCTACARKLHPDKKSHLRVHPVLKVLLCKKCYKYYTSGKFDKDDDGMDEQCRWCAEGGQLLCCDHCTNAFCKACIKRNIGRSALYELLNAPDDAKWKCYVCKPRPLRKLQEDCDRIIHQVNKKSEQKKKAEDKKRAEVYHLSEIRDVATKFLKIQEAVHTDLSNLIKKIDDCEECVRNDSISNEKFNRKKEKIAEKLDNLNKLLKGGTMMLKLTKSLKPDPLSKPVTVSVEKSCKKKLELGPERVLKVRSSLDLNGEGLDESVESDDVVNEPMQISVDVHKVARSSGEEDDNGTRTDDREKCVDDTVDYTDFLTEETSKASEKRHKSEDRGEKVQELFEEDIVALVDDDVELSDSDNEGTSTEHRGRLSDEKENLSSRASGDRVKKSKKRGGTWTDDLPDNRTSPESSSLEEVEFSDKTKEVKDVGGEKSDRKKNKKTKQTEIEEEIMELSSESEEKGKVSTKKRTRKKEDSVDQETRTEKKENRRGNEDKITELSDSEGSTKAKDSDDEIHRSKLKKKTKKEEDIKEILELLESEEELKGTTKKVKGARNEKKKKENNEDEILELSCSEEDLKSSRKTTEVNESDDEKTILKKKIKKHKKEKDEVAQVSGSENEFKRSPKKTKEAKKSDDDKTDLKKIKKDESEDKIHELSDSEDDIKVNKEDKQITSSDSKESLKVSGGVQLKEFSIRLKRCAVDLTDSDASSASRVRDDKDDEERRPTRSSRSIKAEKERGRSKIHSDSPGEKSSKNNDEKCGSKKGDGSGRKSKRSRDNGDEGSAESEKILEEEEARNQLLDMMNEDDVLEEEEARNQLLDMMNDDDGDGDDNSDGENAGEDGLEAMVSGDEDNVGDVANETAKKALEDMMVEDEENEMIVDEEEAKRNLEEMMEEEEEASGNDEEDGKGKVKKDEVKKNKSRKKSPQKSGKGLKLVVKLAQKPSKENAKAVEESDDSSDSEDSDDDDDDEPRKKRKKLKKKAAKGSEKSASAEKRKVGKAAESSDSSDFESLLNKPKPRKTKEASESKDVKKSNTDSSKKKIKKEKADMDSDEELERDIKRLSSKVKLPRKKTNQSSSDSDNDNDVKTDKTESAVNGRRKQKSDDEESDAVVEEIVDDSESDVDESNTAKLFKELGQKPSKPSRNKDCSDDDSSDVIDLDSDDSDSPKKKKNQSKKGNKGDTYNGKKKDQYGEDLLRESLSDDSDSDAKGKRKGKSKESEISIESDSDSGSEIGVKRRTKRKRGAKTTSDSDAGPGKKKRRRIKKISDSEASVISDEEDRPKLKRRKKTEDPSEEEDEDAAPGSAHKRKHIRKIISDKKLDADTKAAAQEEEERRKRVAERQKLYNEIHVEQETLGEDSVPVTTKLALEVDPETKEPVISVDKDLIRNLKPHQVEAVRFMYDCTIESLEQMKKSEGSGCILAHCMGLGKTLSVITLTHTILRHEELLKLRTCLIICPLNTVLNWQNEWEKWFEDTPDVRVDVYELSQYKNNQQRLSCMKDWHTDGGVLIIGYEMFRNLAKGNHVRSKKMKQKFAEYLLNPGPDMVVCDEGHILKNCDSGLSKITSEIKSYRRIVLTGTPLQNNLNEYHCMVSFVKPKLLGTKKEFYNRFVAPITNGSCADSTQRDVRIMKKRAHVLHEMLAGCVQRRDYSALTPYLPPKFEYVVSVRLSKIQMDLYQKYIDFREDQRSNEGTSGTRLFKDFQVLMRVWTHPWVLQMQHDRELEQRAKRADDESDEEFIDDEDSAESAESSKSDTSSDDDAKSGSGSDKPTTSDRARRSRRRRGCSGSDEEIVAKWNSSTRTGQDGEGDKADEETTVEASEWWSEMVNEESKKNLQLSGKLIILFEILKKAEEIGDKVLVFSQSLLSLDIIERFLEFVDLSPGTINGVEEDADADAEPKRLGCTWVKGADYFRLDGSTNAQSRQRFCDVFNDYENPRARLFLISTRAGSLGINLVHANRVVVFDASWNPTYDVQSMFRVYRFGQLKPVYVYRLVAQGTMEEKIYERQVTKQSLSQRVVDEHQIDRHFNLQDLQELYRFEPDRLDDPDRKERPTPALPKDLFLADLLKEQSDWIVGYHEHDSLLENKVDQELTEEERKAAWEEYEAEKKGLVTNATPYMMNQGVSASNWLSHYAQQRGSGLPNYQNPMSQLLMPPDSFLQEVSRQLLRQNPNMSPADVMQRARGYWIRNLQVQELQKQQLLAAQQQELIRLHQMRQQQRLLEHQRAQQAQDSLQRSKPAILQQGRGVSPTSSTMRSLLTAKDPEKPKKQVVIPDD